MIQPLEKSLRNKLEKAVKEARDVAEAAARAALEQIGVGDASAPSFLSEEVRELRRKLRAHGRQLGDSINGGKMQTFDRLIEEVAYEHWHRMLFARFLAENELLMYPDPVSPIAVTLDECEDLAADEGAANGWELAARFATRMLPQIFRIDSPVFQLTLPPEHQQKLEGLVGGLPKEVFSASDSLGWVYQFWQSKRKDEVNASEVKIGARELPAVTQLFTEPYMVAFLLDNSLGAWWAGRRIDAQGGGLKAESEEELKQALSIPGVPLEYLRFVRKDDGTWTPAAGMFDGWPQHLSGLKTLDPCCGSGHFLVSALLMLVPMRMELEGLTAREAVDKVLSENIHGLEIDQRCVELAAFALALTAWRYPDTGGYRPLPELHVACSGLSVGAAREDWKQLALDKHNLRLALDWMYEVFKDAPVLGSLLNPARSEAAKMVQWKELEYTQEQALAQEQSDERHEAGVVAQGLAKAATMLAGKYQWVITNVPYLARGKQNDTLRGFSERYYPAAKNDLATVFLDRCLELCDEGGATSVVLPQNWLFLSGYKSFREKLLQKDALRVVARIGEGGFDNSSAAGAFTALLIARLGAGAFETISGEVVKAICLNFTTSTSTNSVIRGLDVSDSNDTKSKANRLINVEIKSVPTDQVLDDADCRITFTEQRFGKQIQNIAECYQGIVTGDIERFTKKFWEIQKGNRWLPFRRSNNTSQLYGDVSEVLFWENGEGSLHEYAAQARSQLHDMHESGNRAWGRHGIAINRMRALSAVPYYGEHFDNNVAVIYPKKKDENLGALLAFIRSNDFAASVRELDQSLKVTNGTLLKVRFDLDYWTKVAEEKYPNGLPKPYSDDPTQWIFHGHPTHSDEPLQVSVAHLLGYRFPAELDPEMELSDEARALVEKSKELLPYADEDGIVCLPPVRGEASAADRLVGLLAASYGQDWTGDKLAQLLTKADHGGKTLETWLREKFFTQHCKTFQHRPFILHIWDGLRDGFAALVNYHKLDYKNLETLIYTYLGDWISRQKQDIADGVDGAQEKLAAAEALKKKLELILKGEAPYDIFVRWKPIEKQPVGWNPDINDGVRMNIRPFLSVPDVGKRGAGVLRDKPNIKWEKDRGKDVASAPWYQLFNGDRINDHHLSLEEKLSARGNEQ